MLQREQRLLSAWYAVRHLSARRNAARRRIIRRFREKQQKERLLFITILGLIVCRSFMRERNIWIKERSGDWWERIVSSFTQQDWLENFRMSQETFTHLCSLLRPHITNKNEKCHYFNCNYALETSHEWRLPFHWSSVWCF